jgi:hypothetical protein
VPDRTPADQTGQLRGHLGDLAHQAVDLVDEAVERAGQFAQLILAGDGQAAGQVALAGGDVVEVGFHQVQRTQNGVGQQHARGGDHQQHHHGHADDAQQHAFHALLTLASTTATCASMPSRLTDVPTAMSHFGRYSV